MTLQNPLKDNFKNLGISVQVKYGNFDPEVHTSGIAKNSSIPVLINDFKEVKKNNEDMYQVMYKTLYL